MASLRTHDVVLAEGTFRVVLTEKRRVLAVLDAPTTALGPLHIVLGIDRAPFLPRGVSPMILAPGAAAAMSTGFDLGDVGKAIGHAAEGAFDAASKVATTVARPAFDVVKTASGEGAHLLAHTIPFLPESERRKMDAASRVIMRAKLGDITAKQFISDVGNAAKNLDHTAMKIGDTLLDASKVVSHIAELPMAPLEAIPGIGPVVKSFSPFQKWDQIATAIQRGDMKGLVNIAKQTLSEAQSVISLVPGIGTGISAAIGTGVALLEGGSPLDIAIHTAYGAIPIPPGVREVTDTVLDAILALIDKLPHLEDVAVQVARDAVPQGLPRDVFDTLINIVVKHQPLQNVAGGMVDHFVAQYAPHGIGLDVPKALVAATGHLPNVLTHAPPLNIPPHILAAAHAAQPHATLFMPPHPEARHPMARPALQLRPVHA